MNVYYECNILTYYCSGLLIGSLTTEQISDKLSPEIKNIMWDMFINCLSNYFTGCVIIVPNIFMLF